MMINGNEIPDPILGEGVKWSVVTQTVQSVNNTLRSYYKGYGTVYTLTFNKLTRAQYLLILDAMTTPFELSGLIGGTYICLNSPIEGKEGRYWWSLTLTIRNVSW